jgi:CDP-diacylglycerol---serine O-phosphatidyltransferase
VLAYTLGLRTTLDTIILVFFLLCGISRLARFNVIAASSTQEYTSGTVKVFHGLPIPATIWLDAMMGVWIWKGWYEEVNGLPFGNIGEGKPWSVHIASGIFLLWGCGMISNTLKVPKF